MTKIFIIIVSLIFLPIISFNSACIAIDKSGSYCVPNDEFTLDQLSLEISKQKILQIKGAPPKTFFDKELRLEILEYPNLTIEINNDKILYMNTSTSSVKTTSGIHPGMTKNEVMKILKYELRNIEKREYQFVNCTKEVYLVLKFNEDKRLKSIGMGSDLP